MDRIFSRRLRLIALCVLACACVSLHGQEESSPHSGAVVLPSEALGPDDLVEILVPYCTELSRSFRISAVGTLTLPLLGSPIKAAGLLPTELAVKIADALTKDGVMAEPIVDVSVIEYRSRPVNVIGAVNRPLTFQATGETSLLDAITRAGGFSPSVGANVLVVMKYRNEQGQMEDKVKVIPVKKLTSSADPGYNIPLRGGEQIRVPEAAKIFVAGNVNRPGAFLMQGDADTTIVKALALSAGLAPYSAQYAYIYRINAEDNKREELKVPLGQIMKRKAPDVALQADDILYVPDNNGKRLTARVLNQIAGVGGAAVTGLAIYH